MEKPIKMHFDLDIDVMKECLERYSKMYDETDEEFIERIKSCLKDKLIDEVGHVQESINNHSGTPLKFNDSRRKGLED